MSVGIVTMKIFTSFQKMKSPHKSLMQQNSTEPLKNIYPKELPQNNY